MIQWARANEGQRPCPSWAGLHAAAAAAAAASILLPHCALLHYSAQPCPALGAEYPGRDQQVNKTGVKSSLLSAWILPSNRPCVLGQYQAKWGVLCAMSCRYDWNDWLFLHAQAPGTAMSRPPMNRHSQPNDASKTRLHPWLMAAAAAAATALGSSCSQKLKRRNAGDIVLLHLS